MREAVENWGKRQQREGARRAVRNWAGEGAKRGKVQAEEGGA